MGTQHLAGEDQQESDVTRGSRSVTVGTAVGAVAATAILVGGITVLVRSMGDDSEPGTSPTAETTTSAPSATGSPSEPSSADTADSPGVEERWAEQALRATRAGIAAFVPAELPADWRVTKGTFEKDGPRWLLELSSPAGPVVLDQADASAKSLVDRSLGADARAAGRLDLSKWGTGTWQVWRTTEAVAVTFGLETSTVAVSGPDLETLRALAITLITAEDAPVGGLDG
jgi:hypothetical protein